MAKTVKLLWLENAEIAPRPPIAKRVSTPKPLSHARVLTKPAPREIALIYTYHRPTHPHRSASLHQSPNARSAQARDRVNPAALANHRKLQLVRTQNKSLLVAPQSPPKSPTKCVSPFIKSVFPNYSVSDNSKMLKVDEEEQCDMLNFIQEVQPSREHSENSDRTEDEVTKTIRAGTAEFRIKATCTTVSQSTISRESTGSTRNKCSRVPYKDLSVVGFLPLEDFVTDFTPHPRELRQRRKTYTGAGGFTVLAKRFSISGDMDYIPPTPTRPQTQIERTRRHRSVVIEARIPRAQSSLAQNA